MNSMLKSIQVATITSLLASACGCSWMQIHNETREKQGVEAKESWSKVNTEAVIVVERENLAQLLKTELDTQDKLALAIRDHTLREIVDSDSISDSLFTKVDGALEKLVGPDGLATVDSARTIQSSHRAWTAKLADKQDTWSQVSALQPPPQCTDVLDSVKTKARRLAIKVAVTPSPADSAETIRNKRLAEATLEEIENACRREPDATPFSSMGGAMESTHLRYATDIEEAAAAKANLSVQAAEYNAAVKSYTEALKTTNAQASTKTTEAFTRLQTAINALESAPDAWSRQFIAKERLDSLNNYVDAVTQATKDSKLPEGANKATVAFVLFPKLVDDANKSLNDAKAPLALPLLIQRNYEQLQLEAVTREVEARESMVRISGAMEDTIFDQAKQLAIAKSELDKVKNIKEVKGQSTADAFKNTPPKYRTSLYRGTALYLDTLNRLEARRYKLEYQYIAAQHELQLAYAEVNAKQWSSLIGATVDQVATASAGGVKPERVVALLNMLGIFYIGYGVNK